MPYTVSQDESPWAPRPTRRPFAPIPKIEDYQQTPAEGQAAYWKYLAQFANSQPTPPGGRKTIHLGLGKIILNLMAAKALRDQGGAPSSSQRYEDAWRQYKAKADMGKEDERLQDRDLDRALRESQIKLNEKQTNYNVQKPYDTNVTTEERYWLAHPGLEQTDPLAYQRELGKLKGQQKIDFHIAPQPREPREPHHTRYETFPDEQGKLWSWNPENPSEGYKPLMGPGGEQATKGKPVSAPGAQKESPLQKKFRDYEGQLRLKKLQQNSMEPLDAKQEAEVATEMSQYKANAARSSGQLPHQRLNTGHPTDKPPMPSGGQAPGKTVTVRTKDGRVLTGQLDAQGNFIPGTE